jgi:hypothetical protein
VRSNRGDQGLVHASRKHHQSCVTGFGVGNAKTGDEFALFAHLSKGTGQLHTTTVDDGNLVSVGDEVGDGFAGCVENLLVLKSGTA